MSQSNVSTSRNRTHKLTVTAMLSAVAFILMFIEFPIPALIPSFVKMDVSDLPELLAAFPNKYQIKRHEGKGGATIIAYKCL